MAFNRLTELLGIKYPILLGAMHWVGDAGLAAAVSNAGGLGVMSSARFRSGEELRREIRKVRELTDRPFGVNLSLNRAMGASKNPRPNDEFIQAMIEEKIPVAETSGAASPEVAIRTLKEAGVKVVHKAATVRHVAKGEACGADAVALVGYENGGNLGMEDTTTFVLLQKAVRVLKVPIVAGGGVADGRGLLALLALGAEGVLMGTRFLATRECPAHEEYKRWILRSLENETLVVQRTIRNTHRVLKNAAAEEVLAMEARGTTTEELLPWISGEKYRRCILDGALQEGMAYCGQVAGLIDDIPRVSEVVERTVEGALETLGAMKGWTLGR